MVSTKKQTKKIWSILAKEDLLALDSADVILYSEWLRAYKKKKERELYEKKKLLSSIEHSKRSKMESAEMEKIRKQIKNCN